MSADNVILIKRINGAWHVWHASMSMFVEGNDEPVKGDLNYKIFDDWEDAKIYAEDLEKELEFVEYGIVEVGAMSDAVAREQKRLDGKAVEDVVNKFKGKKNG